MSVERELQMDRLQLTASLIFQLGTQDPLRRLYPGHPIEPSAYRAEETVPDKLADISQIH